MDIFSTKIKNKLKSLIPFRRVDPHIYWNNLLVIFFILIIVLIIFSLYLLFKIKNQPLIQITPIATETPSLVNEKLLERVNDSFESKSVKQKEIKEGGIIYKDPSMN